MFHQEWKNVLDSHKNLMSAFGAEDRDRTIVALMECLKSNRPCDNLALISMYMNNEIEKPSRYNQEKIEKLCTNEKDESIKKSCHNLVEYKDYKESIEDVKKSVYSYKLEVYYFLDKYEYFTIIYIFVSLFAGARLAKSIIEVLPRDKKITEFFSLSSCAKLRKQSQASHSPPDASGKTHQGKSG
ncbi:hypothetical protein Gxy13693_087_004 [Komagataeibacter xylinus NBRC 13693]|uniref:Uncharacterized protein n=2 Tax=Komagataeibacter xylinus TaxID=28448 RepID=A0A0D6QDU5_KOMXY|nr:hypothetical protein Gxy13693_087_004 [Komagataeibacter xylinus NBRC 13693]